MNILLLSAGTREYLVRYFRGALSGGSVVAADADSFSPALYEADSRYIVSPVTSPDYIRRVLAVCEKERIAGVLSLIDPELSVLAKHERQFAALGVKVVGSSLELCEFAYDKRRTYRWLTENGYPCARYWTDPASFFRAEERGEVRFPVIIKPAKGSASVGTVKVQDRAEVEFLLARKEGVLIQEFMNGREIGADVYVDLISGETVSVFAKQKIRMRAGETDRAVSFKDKRLFALIERFIAETGFRGPIDVDLFEVGGEYYITDVNPRFGGGYPHAHLCGCDHTKMVVENLKGNINPKRIGVYESGICMMKYSGVRLIPEKETVIASPFTDINRRYHGEDAESGKSI